MAGQKAATRSGADEDIMTRAPSREVYEFTLGLATEENPDGIDEAITHTDSFGPIRTIGLVLLTPLEEKSAASRAQGDTMKIAYELATMSLAEINGKKVAMHDGTKDQAFFEMHPQIRNLVMQAYADMNVSSTKATASFLKSRKVKA